MGDKSQTGFDGDSVANEVGSRTDLAALPDAVRAVLEEFRAQAAASSTKPPPSVSDSQDLPYTCRLYESIPGEEELLQLQWMRVDVRMSARLSSFLYKFNPLRSDFFYTKLI